MDDKWICDIHTLSNTCKAVMIKQMLFTLVGLVIVNFFASSLNSLITNVYPMLMSEKINSGLYAEVLNGFCYLGSTVSSYGLGIIADNFGWNTVFLVLMGFCVMICFIWFGYIYTKRILKVKEVFQ